MNSLHQVSQMLSKSKPPIQPQTTCGLRISRLGVSGLEIACGFDGLTSIDELAPGLAWDELLAATWGLPSTSQKALVLK